jgi:hypothetical protein
MAAIYFDLYDTLNRNPRIFNPKRTLQDIIFLYGVYKQVYFELFKNFPLRL